MYYGTIHHTRVMANRITMDVTNNKSGARYAMKVLNRTWKASTKIPWHIANEIKILDKLKGHPNIIAIQGIATTEGKNGNSNEDVTIARHFTRYTNLTKIQQQPSIHVLRIPILYQLPEDTWQISLLYSTKAYPSMR